jgi:hypothetical protein
MHSRARKLALSLTQSRLLECSDSAAGRAVAGPPVSEVAMSLLRPALVVRLGNELNDLASDGSVPDFVHAEHLVEARRQWVRLVALTVVVSTDELSDLRTVRWLRCHPTETTAALHDLRLYNWTVVSTLVCRRVLIGYE